MALLLVLGVVAAVAILGYAMLSASSMHAQVGLNAQDAVQGRYLADSGISYAMYYLRYPERSPVPLTAGPFDNHYGGEYGLLLWPEAPAPVDIQVTNTSKGNFLIRSTAIVDGLTQVAEAEVTIRTSSYQVTTAASFGGPVTLPSQVTITGAVSAVATITNSLGNVLTSLGGSSITVSASAVPRAADIRLLTETSVTASTGGKDRTYTIDGVTYVAEEAPSTITGTLLTSRPSLNPANVWYAEKDVTLNDATINGTLIVRGLNRRTDLQGVCTIANSHEKMPALVVEGETRQKHQTLKAARVTINGVAWIGGNITSNGTPLAAGFMNINGSLLMGSTTPGINANNATMAITKTTAVNSVELTAGNAIEGISVNRWTHP